MKPSRPRILAAALIGGFGVTGSWSYAIFWSDLAMAHAKRQAHIKTFAGRLSLVEYGISRQVFLSPAVKNAGACLEQSLAFAAPFVGAGYRLIVPLQLTYLGETMRADRSKEGPLDALVKGLEPLDIHGSATIGGSTSPVSAATFAFSYPNRCHDSISRGLQRSNDGR